MTKAQKEAEAQAKAEEKAQKEAEAQAKASKGAKVEVILKCWYGDKAPNTKISLKKDIADGLISRGNAREVE